MERFSKILSIFEKYSLILSLALMTAVTFGNVLSRKIFNFSWAFAEELTVILFIFSSLVGAAMAAQKGSLIGLTLISDKVKNKTFFYIVGIIVSVFFTYIVVRYGISMVISEYKSGIKTPALGLPEWIFGLSIPIGGLNLGYRLLEFNLLSLYKEQE